MFRSVLYAFSSFQPTNNGGLGSQYLHKSLRTMYHRYHNLYFTTATILEWKYLLQKDMMKDVVIDSLRFLVKEQRAVIYAFVIMPNHIHLVWYIPEPHTLTDVKAALLSYTGHQFKKRLQAKSAAELERYRVNLVDRTYQFWERNALSIAIFHDAVFWQKMEYVHWNPCTERWKLATAPELYKYSSVYAPTEEIYWDFVALW